MYTKEELAEFAGDLKYNFREWAFGKIDELFPKSTKTKVLLKNGLNNWMAREDVKINKFIDMSTLFIADENGNIDTDSAVDIIVEMFKETPVQESVIWGMPVSYGKGEIVLSVPHNFMFDMVFGRLGQIRLTTDDLLELKDLFKTA